VSKDHLWARPPQVTAITEKRTHSVFGEPPSRQSRARELQDARTCRGCGGLQLTPGHSYCEPCAGVRCGYCNHLGNTHADRCPRVGLPRPRCRVCGGALSFPRARLCDACRINYCATCNLHGGRHRGRHRPPAPYLGTVTTDDLNAVLLANFSTALRVAGRLVGPELARDTVHDAVAKLLMRRAFLRSGTVPQYFLSVTWGVALATVRRRRERLVDSETLEMLGARWQQAERGRRVLAAVGR
jgi:hypothetical protein